MTCTPEKNSASSHAENGILIANPSPQDSSSSRLVDQVFSLFKGYFTLPLEEQGK